MSALPAGWATTSIADVALFNPKTIAEDSMNAGFAPMQTLGTRYRHRMVFEERSWGEIKKAYVHFQPGDVIVAKVTPCFENGKAGIAPPLPNGIGAGSSEFCVFRPAHGVDGRYLLAWLSTEDFRRRATVAMTGSVGLKRVPKEVFLSERIPLAPESEQKRIADKLDTVLTRVDAVNTRLAHVAPLLKRFRQSVLAAATSGRLTEDWRDTGLSLTAWVRTTLGAISADLRYGTSKKCTTELVGNAVLRIPNIGSDGQPELSDLKYAQFDSTEQAKLALRVGDLLIIRSNGSLDLVGKCCVVNEQAAGMLFAGYLMRLRVEAALALPSFIFLSLSSPLIRGLIERAAKSTSGVNNINSEELRSLPLHLPPLDEQAEIVRRVEILFALASRLEARLQSAQSATERLTPALLAKAFRGELVPQDPNDEPASELLRHLRQDAQSTSIKRGRKSAA